MSTHLEHPRLSDPERKVSLPDARATRAQFEGEADLALECYVEIRRRDPDGRDPDINSHKELAEAAIRYANAMLQFRYWDHVVSIKLELAQRQERKKRKAQRP